MTLYTQVTANRQKSGFYLVLFTALLLGVGYLAATYLDRPELLPLAAILSIIQGFVGWYASDTVALAASGAEPVEDAHDGGQGERLHRIVETLCIATGLPKPRIFIIPQAGMNAFATGRDPKHAAVAVTAGLLQNMNDREVAGVLAHELGHVGNEDIRLMSLVAVLAGSITLLGDMVARSLWWGGGRRRNNEEGGNGIGAIVMIVVLVAAPVAATLIQLAISRKREFLADATAVLTTRDAAGLISALRKLDEGEGAAAKVEVSRAVAHLFIANPFGGLAGLFSTHPPIAERIAALEQGSGMR